jgi:hypothetical protein
VPEYLRRRQRRPIVPQPPAGAPAKGEAEAEDGSMSWTVPSYNSHMGFQEGFYDELSQTVYFD